MSSSHQSASHLLKQSLVLAIVLLTVAFAGAQKNAKAYALLFGTIWGPDSRPLAGVTIRIRRAEDKKPKWTLISDSRGEFAQRVPAGTHDYIIWAETKGKKDAKPLETKVHVDNDERVDFGLHLIE